MKPNKVDSEDKFVSPASMFQDYEVQRMFASAKKFMDLGRLPEAEHLCRQILAKDPRNIEAISILGVLTAAAGRYDEAISLYQKVVTINPQYAGAYYNLGNVLKEKGDVGWAILCYGQCIALAPEFSDAYRNFAHLLKTNFFQPINEAVPLYRRALRTCFEKNFVDPEDIDDAVIDLLLDKGILDTISRFLDHGDAGFLFSDQKLSGLLADELLLLLLKNVLCRNVLLESLLTKTRMVCLLNVASDNDTVSLPPHLVKFIYALARQCFWNEYVWYESAEEKEAEAAILKKIENYPAPGGESQRLLIALLGCYMPLLSIKELVYPAVDDADQDFAELVKIQIGQRQNEIEIQPTIERLARIGNEISRAVQQQYEENPYPRWLNIRQTQQVSFMKSLRAMIRPNEVVIPPAMEGKLDVLVAGCGTGCHPLTLASNCPEANILAIDLSLASLAYAKRKAVELGIDNVHFAQADILSLQELDRRFDVIECVGVLHHMENPVAGWRILAGLLKPGGFMKVGLYSKLARRHIVVVREMIRKFDYPPTAEGIRECRKHIFSLPDDPILKKCPTSRDFFSISRVRDMLFHVQEHTFTLPEISEIINDLRMDMMGFVIDEKIKEDYLSKFPDDPGCVSFAGWDRYERDNPDTFVLMYNFWLQKR